jgi:bifunctional non-homologous end joining protein LigD
VVDLTGELARTAEWGTGSVLQRATDASYIKLEHLMSKAENQSRDLRDYSAKRDFERTPEPVPRKRTKRGLAPTPEPAPRKGGRAKSAAKQRSGESRARFVVHEHHARRLHWDLRLERGGTLMSWAVPNGIPLDPAHNRKAIHVEDHPLSYIDFEGEIPEGSYGAGRVLIWDSGRYDCEKLREDELIVVFHGRRLQGRYALFRTGDEKDWMIHRMDPPVHPREAMPEHLAPMLARTGRLPRDEEQWAFEVKWDGVRAISYWRPGRLRIESRNLKEIDSRYPELRALGRQLGMREAVLDGEIVAFDERGLPSFERLQKRMHLASESAIRRAARETPVTYAIFDLLYLDGRLTTELPYRRRRELLEQLQLKGPAWQVPTHHQGGGRELLAATAEQGLEGVIAKRLDSLYRPGQRGGEWVKVKNVNKQEFVIGGWLPGKDGRSGQLGALLVGYYDRSPPTPAHGEHPRSDHRSGRRELRYAGRVGTGFDEPELRRLAEELAARGRRSSPFAKHGIQPPPQARFVKPELVAEIEFSRWTRDRILRHSSYKGLRSDKPALEVSREAVLEETADDPTGQVSDRPYEVVHETKRHLEIETRGRRLRLSNREKVLYPDAGFTKGQLIDYYAEVAPVLLPHLAGRPVTLKRYPDGVGEPYFYEKRCPAHRPEWVQTAPVWSGSQAEEIDYCLVEDLPTLIWVANLAAVELHPSLARARDLDSPTALVFDLDPGEPAGLRECCRVALAIKEIFDTFALRALVKSSGSKGLQVYVPLNTKVSYEQTKPFARAVAELLEKQLPKLVVSRMTKRLRSGRVLIDWSQNDPHKTTVSVYSLRAHADPLISTPLTWEEVQRGSRRRRDHQLSLRPAELLKRIARDGDLFAEVLSLTQGLPDLGRPGAGQAPHGNPRSRPDGDQPASR